MTLNPHRITIALDRAGLVGPTADAKLGAREPDLDNWEAGRTQPTHGQLRKLAGMARVPMEFFHLPDDAEPRVVVARVMLRRHCEVMVTLADREYEPITPSLFDSDRVRGRA